jgi:hypothetical protein
MKKYIALTGFFLILVLAAFTVFPTKAVSQSVYEYRTIDGYGNNLWHPEWGSAGVTLLRFADVGYEDRIGYPGGQDRRSARAISNILAAQNGSVPNSAGVSDFVWQWGQFLDHDIDLTPEAYPQEPFYIAVPESDPFFDPEDEGNKYIFLNRSIYDGGYTRRHPREQLNLITAYIDASNVYGSNGVRATALRTLEGGKLKTNSGGQFLPFNTEDLPNAGGRDPRLFLAGDVRANEQIALTAMHTLFVREHNRLCDEIAAENPSLSDQHIYQWARKIVGAQMQVITYNEFLPVLLGPDALPRYRGYKRRVNAGIVNEFSTAAYRFGHSMLSPTLLRVNMPGNEPVATELRDAFFNPRLVRQGGGIACILRGLATQRAQEVDNKIVNGVRNFLFGEPGQGGVRRAYGLGRVRDFSDITSEASLASVYDSIDDMDLWVAGLAEDHVSGGLLGEPFRTILIDQFVRLRDGDRFWYQNDPFFTNNPALMAEVASTQLSDIIRRNTHVGDELQDNVFIVP